MKVLYLLLHCLHLTHDTVMLDFAFGQVGSMGPTPLEEWSEKIWHHIFISGLKKAIINFLLKII